MPSFRLDRTSEDVKREPSRLTTLSGASVSLRLASMMLSKPLQTDSISMRAAVPMAIPAALIAEITLMTLWLFLANRYLSAMNRLTFKPYFFSNSSMCSA